MSVTLAKRHWRNWQNTTAALHDGPGKNRPFVLVYQEAYDDSKVARQREIFLKSGQGRQWLDETLDK